MSSERANGKPAGVKWPRVEQRDNEAVVRPSAPSRIEDSAMELVRAFLDKDGWHPRKLPDQPIFRVGYAGKNGRYRCYAQVRAELFQFVFYALSPLVAPDDCRPKVAEFIARANYGMRIGNFELDFDDGEIRYKSSVDYEGAALTVQLIRNVILPAVTTMDAYQPGLSLIIESSGSARDAIALVETD